MINNYEMNVTGLIFPNGEWVLTKSTMETTEVSLILNFQCDPVIHTHPKREADLRLIMDEMKTYSKSGEISLAPLFSSAGSRIRYSYNIEADDNLKTKLCIRFSNII